MQNINNTFNKCLNQSLEKSTEWINEIMNRCNENDNTISSKKINKRRMFKGLIEDDEVEGINEEKPTEPYTDIAGIYEEGNVGDYSINDYKGYFITPLQFMYIFKSKRCNNIAGIDNCEIKFIYNIEIDTKDNSMIYLFIYFFIELLVIKWDEGGYNNETSMIVYTEGSDIINITIAKFEESKDKTIKDPFSDKQPVIIRKDEEIIEMSNIKDYGNAEFTRFSIYTNNVILIIDSTDVVSLSDHAFNVQKIPSSKSFKDKFSDDKIDYYYWGIGDGDRFSMTINQNYKTISVNPILKKNKRDGNNDYKYYLLNNGQCGRIDKTITTVNSFNFDSNYNITFDSVEERIENAINSSNSELHDHLLSIPKAAEEDNYSDNEVTTKPEVDEEEYYEGSSGTVINDDEDDGLSGGEIAAIVIACVVFVLIIIIIIYFCACRTKKEKHMPKSPYEDAPTNIYTHKVSVNANSDEFKPKTNKSFITVKA